MWNQGQSYNSSIPQNDYIVSRRSFYISFETYENITIIYKN